MGNLKKPRTKSGKPNAAEEADQQDALQNPEVLVGDAQQFFDKYKNLLTYIALGIAVAVGAGVFYFNNLKEKEAEAQQKIFYPTYEFEADSLNRALNGTGMHMGFLEIIDTYGGTEAANLSAFYAGVSYLKLGEYDNAIKYLKDFSSSDYVLQARAYCLIGDAHMQLKQPTEAIAFYKKAIDYKPNKQFTPSYYIKLGIAYQESKNFAEAEKTYQALIDNYPLSVEANEAKKQMAMVKNLQAAS